MNGSEKERVLALHPHTGGLAFAVFDGPLNVADYGVKEVRGRCKNAIALFKVARIVEQYEPDIIVLADRSSPHGRSTSRIRRLQKLILNYADGEMLETYCFGRADIHACFRDVGAVTRYEIARSIAARIHVLKDRLPKAPNIWRSQTERLGLFDAAALAMTYYCQKECKDSPPKK